MLSPNARPDPEHDTIREYVDALPLTSAESPIISEAAALTALARLESTGSPLPEHLTQQSAAMAGEVGKALEPVPDHEGAFVITRDELRGAISKAAIRGAAQATTEIGQAIYVTHGLEQLLQNPPATDEPATEPSQ